MAPSHCSTGKASPSEHTHGHETLVEELHVEVCKSPDYRPHLEALADAIYFLALSFMEGITIMSNDFSKLSAGLDALAAVITQVISDLQNEETNNNDQGVIDSLTARLQTAVDALTAADAAEKAEDAPAPAPVEPAPAPAPAPVDGTGSTDVTP